MSGMKCLATLRLLITFPARTPILAGSFRCPGHHALNLGELGLGGRQQPFPVRRAFRPRQGLWQAISRSPG